MWCMPPANYREKRYKIRDKGPSHLRRYGGRTAPIPDSFLQNATCRSGRQAYPEFLYDFFLEFPVLAGTDLCPFGKCMVQNGVFLRGLRNRVGGPSCFPQALCDKKKQVCEGTARMEEGLDSDGNTFSTREVMWEIYTGDETGRTEWYTKGVNYWSVSVDCLSRICVPYIVFGAQFFSAYCESCIQMSPLMSSRTGNSISIAGARRLPIDLASC